MADLFTQNVSTILVLGAGNLGADTAAAGALEDHCGDALPFACWAAAHTYAARLLATGLERKLLLDAGPAASGPFAERAVERSLAAQDEMLRRILAGRSTVVLCGALCEDDGALLLPVLARTLSTCGVATWAVALDDGRAAELLPMRTYVPIACAVESLNGAGYVEARKKLLLAVQQLLRALSGVNETEVSLPATAR
jgi:hypothetical protein